MGEDQGDTEAEEGKNLGLVSRGLVSALWSAELQWSFGVSVRSLVLPKNQPTRMRVENVG